MLVSKKSDDVLLNAARRRSDAHGIVNRNLIRIRRRSFANGSIEISEGAKTTGDCLYRVEV